MNRVDGLTIAELVEGLAGVTVLGNSSAYCLDALPLCDAIEGCITMVDESSRCDRLRHTGAVAVVTTEPLHDVSCAQIVCDDVHAVFTAIVARFRYPATEFRYSAIDASALIDPTASIGPGTRIDAGVTVGANVVIGRDSHLMAGVVVMEHSAIGDHCRIYPRVVIYEHTKIDNHVNIHAGCVIGAHGFGYRQAAGKHVPTAQLGFVHIESDVDLGANVTIDRGTYGATRIGEGTKIDNLVQIAHNCHIGKHNLICSQVGIAGSCKTGDYVILAGQVGLADHVVLGDYTIVGAQAGVMENLAGHQTYLGSPATQHRDQMQILAVQRKLPDMRREIRSLRRDLEQLQTGVQELSEQHEQSAPEAEARQADDEGEAGRPACIKFQRPAA